MNINEVRSKYLEFFKQRDHKEIPSAPIVPNNDPTTLFTISGMQPLIPYLMGKEHPLGKKLTNSQKCFRADDIDEIGDNRHTTFFEMLGNWSLGDYWKKEQLEWYFDFLVEKIGLDPNRIYVTCFIGEDSLGIEKDEESENIWKKIFARYGISAKSLEVGSEEDGYKIGMKDARIFFYDTSKNWWSRSGSPSDMPVGEIGGPDSEVFYDLQTPHDKKYGEFCHVNCDCGRFLELGNSVFIEYIKTKNGFERLQQRNIDHGSGLERIAMVSSGLNDLFDLDVFKEARQILLDGGIKYNTEANKKASRIILDHMRAALFMISDGVMPSNKGSGYILRRLIRRALSNAYNYSNDDSPEILSRIIKSMHKYYNDHFRFEQSEEEIAQIIKNESEAFFATITKAMKMFSKGKRDPFVLHTTYGLPVDIIRDIFASHNIHLDEEELRRKIEEHKQLSRQKSDKKFKGGLEDSSEEVTRLHTAHHLLLAALKKVLSEDIKQRGSNITKDRLRMDFSFDRKLTEEEKVKIEDIVNDWIKQDLPVTKKIMPLEEAIKIGAEMEFMAKYPPVVSVYFIGNEGNYISKEFCGGPHVSSTGELGKFKIKKEESSARGIRRIKAILIQD